MYFKISIEPIKNAQVATCPFVSKYCIAIKCHIMNYYVYVHYVLNDIYVFSIGQQWIQWTIFVM